MDLFIARQPIFTARLKVYAYELLFRSGPANFFPDVDVTHASARVIADSLFNVGLEILTSGKLAFINIARDVLVSDAGTLLPKDKVVLEILETVTPDDEVIAACRRLKDAGYQIALDDFVDAEEYAPLVTLADIIKVDVLATAPAARRAMVARYAPRGIRLLAEKIETQEMFHEAVDQGYTYFQGYFFARPSMMQARSAPEFRLTYLRLLQESSRPDVDLRRMAAIIGQDVTMSYRLLRRINSAYYGLRGTVSSITEAVRLLGVEDLRRWASLLFMAALGANKPPELVVESALRGRFCENLAGDAGLAEQQGDLFILGMFSLLDAMLDRPLSVLVAELPLAPAVKAALLGESNPLGRVLECAVAYISGDWTNLPRLVATLGLAEDALPTRYREALIWVQQTLPAGGSDRA
jgi:c-di-GMP-related signal transduction protein